MSEPTGEQFAPLLDEPEYPCPECGEVFTGPKAGPGGGPFQLARHRRSQHNVLGKRAAKAKAKAAAAADDEPTSTGARVLSAVRDIADEVGHRKGVPTADDLAKGLGRGLGLSTVAVASFMVESDPGIPDGPAGDTIRNGLVEYLSLDSRTSVSIMAPIGKTLAPTKINKRYGRQIVDNVDTVGSVAELGILAMHWRKYLRARNGVAATAPILPAGGPPVAPPGDPAFAPVPVILDDGTHTMGTPPMQSGVVISAESVAELHRQRAQA